MIEVDGLVHVYAGGTRAVDGVSLSIRDGETVAIIGQNGSGKSTLVRHLNGLLRPTEGRVLVGGVDAAGRRVAQLAAIVGLAFQDPDRQIFAGSVRAEVAFGPRNLGMADGDVRTAVDEALTATGLEGDAETNPYDLGYSRRKLLALASILAMRSPVVVLDEPTTGQDARGVARVRAIVGALRDAGRTVIAISHDMAFVAEKFERVVVMRQGRVVLDGPPRDVFGESAWPTLRSSFLEPPLPALAGARLGLGATRCRRWPRGRGHADRGIAILVLRAAAAAPPARPPPRRVARRANLERPPRQRPIAAPEPRVRSWGQRARRVRTTSRRNDVSTISTPAMISAMTIGSGWPTAQPTDAANSATARKTSRTPRTIVGRSGGLDRSAASAPIRRRPAVRSATPPTTATPTSTARTAAGGVTTTSTNRASHPNAVATASATRPRPSGAKSRRRAAGRASVVTPPPCHDRRATACGGSRVAGSGSRARPLRRPRSAPSRLTW